MQENSPFPEYGYGEDAKSPAAVSEDNFSSENVSTAPASDDEFVIRTFGLTKTYNGRKVVDNVSLSVKRGAIYGFIGNNGAGKSTIIRMLTGLAVPTDGKIELFGKTDERSLNEARRKTGAIVEVPSLYPTMTADENLTCRGLLLGKKCDHAKLLGFVGLNGTGKKKVKDFSLGMKQRLAIAVAIYGEPELLILDEPINGLDPAGIYEVRELLRDVNTRLGTTVFISSHILGELSKIASNYGIIKDGQLVKEMSADEVRAQCRSYIRLVVDDAGKAIEVLDEELGIRKLERFENNTIRIYERLNDLPVINQTLNKRDVLVLSSEVGGDDAEDYFVKLMGGVL